MTPWARFTGSGAARRARAHHVGNANHVPIIPRIGETIRLDGDFRRRGAFVVERVEYMLCCDSRAAGWVRDLSVHVSLFVREN